MSLPPSFELFTWLRRLNPGTTYVPNASGALVFVMQHRMRFAPDTAKDDLILYLDVPAKLNCAE